MKSAYEKALERLEQESGPTQSLTDGERAQIAEIDRKYEAKVAETKIAFESKIAKAQTAQEHDQLTWAMTDEIASLSRKQEEEKEAVWNKAKG